ncbi:hypothetical protein ACFFRR_003182 [Megaselia abdita]
MKTATFFIISAFFWKGALTNNKNIDSDIQKCEKNLLDFINKHVPESISQLLKSVSEHKLKDVDKTVADRQKLEFLVIEHFNGFEVLHAKIMELTDNLAELTEDILKAATLKRGDLDMSTLIYPFEYYGHKCGFNRKVTVD